MASGQQTVQTALIASCEAQRCPAYALRVRARGP